MSRVLKTYKNKVTSDYGKRGNSMHNGIDIVGNKNGVSSIDYIVAHSDGKVTSVQKNMDRNTKSSGTASYGNYVKIEHENGYSTLYAHMAKGSITVKVGDFVKQGQVIGYMGNTGNSYGAHLHFEVRKNNVKIDPTPYINADLPIIKEKVKEIIKEVTKPTKPIESEVKKMIYNKIQDLPTYAKPIIQKLVNKKYLVGDSSGNLSLSEDMVRILVILDRAKVFD